MLSTRPILFKAEIKKKTQEMSKQLCDVSTYALNIVRYIFQSNPRNKAYNKELVSSNY